MARMPMAFLKSRGVTLVFAGVLANWPLGFLRFASPAVNATVLLVSTLVLLAASVRATSGSPRVLRLALLLCAVFACLFMSLMAAMQLLSLATRGGVDGAFELLATAPVQAGRVSVYRTDCGATCNFGITVRHERAILPGLLLVRRLGGFYPAYEASVEAVDGQTVRVMVPVYGNVPATFEVFRTSPRVYF